MLNIRTFTGLLHLLPLAAAMVLTSCQVATPASRIGEHPQLFAALPEQDKPLVQQGQIRAGMSPDAVFLAWGAPNSRPFVGEREGKRMERWVYTRPEPVMVTPGWNAPCWGADGWCHGHMGVETAYVPRNTAEVVFSDGKVISWEARQ